MSDFVKALNEKILELEADKEALLFEISQIDAKISLIKELTGDTSAPKKRGRPPKAATQEKGKTSFPMDPAVLSEASQMEGTDPELASRLAVRSVHRTREPSKGYGPGIRVGTKDEVLGGPRKSGPSNAVISIEDDENEPV
jgi:hypothetical protein